MIMLVSLSYMMTYEILMYCFDDQRHAQCMRLYIHIEKYQNGSIDICVMRFGSAYMKGTNPSPSLFYFDFPDFFLYIDKYDDVGYIQ